MFNKEEEILSEARNFLKLKNLGDDGLWSAYEKMTQTMESLLSETHFLTKMSDRLQKKLNNIIEDLHYKKTELESAQHIIIRQNQELQERKNSLEEQIQERTLELKNLLNDLLAANAELDNFVYRASHDIRGPIARLLGICNIALIESKEDKSIEYFNMLHDNASQMNFILERLLNVNNLKNSEIFVEEINLKSVLEHAISSVKHLSNFPSITIELSIPQTLEILTDGDILVILLQNLLEQAIINIQSNTLNKKFICISSHKSPKQTIIDFKFSGIPIPTDQKEDVFKIFFRLTNNTESSGIELFTTGLAATKIAGTIQLISSDESLTHFRIQLPKRPKLGGKKRKFSKLP